ncbi:hypothetical protein HHK36_031873 [Tetracentron sinense]|uniref:Pentatricopeptide repeat-containing protein n=1 Tax=Tetracentron sinense TaxID=13715 RepID=A0A835CY61_TETSI|nr:hypothetical protein HHK36_031873 [Tetracentron sinense]
MAMRSAIITKLLKLNRPHLFLIENCSDIKELKQFHCQFITNGLSNDTIFLSTILSFSAISPARDLAYARLVFSQIDSPNLFMFNTMIRGYAWSSTPEKATSLYIHMLHSGLFPNKYTFPFVIKASSSITDLASGRTIHGSVMKFGYGSDVHVSNSLLHMYANFGFSEVIIKLFEEIPEPDVVSWNVVIDNFAQCGHLDEVLIAFSEMCYSGVEPNSVTNDLHISINLGNGLLDMYAKFGDLDSAEKLFNRMLVKTVFSWTSMVDGLVRTGNVENARLMFNQMPDKDTTSWNVMLNGFIMAGDMNSADQHFKMIPERDLVSWNSIIVGYAQHKQFVKSLDFFREMRVSGVNPDRVTLVSMLSVCGFTGAMDHGEVIHSYMEKNNVKGEEVEVALLDMYCKCGAPEKALSVFHGVFNKSCVGLDCYDCWIGHECYGGLVEEGRWFFNAINQVYGIEPRSEHYGSMVDILGRAGLLKEAEIFIQNMPIKPDAGVWGALLGACKIHDEIYMGEKVAKILTEMDPHHSGRYVLLSNIYAMEKRWHDVERVREAMKAHGVRKTAGFSLIETAR